MDNISCVILSVTGSVMEADGWQVSHISLCVLSEAVFFVLLKLFKLNALCVLQTVFSIIVLAVSLLITLVSVVVWQRNVRRPRSGSHYTPVASTTPPAADVSNSAASIQDGSTSIQEVARSPPMSPTHQSNNYQACAVSLGFSSELEIGFAVLFSALAWALSQHAGTCKNTQTTPK